MILERIEYRYNVPDPDLFTMIIHVSRIARHDAFLLADELESMGYVRHVQWLKNCGSPLATIEVDPYDDAEGKEIRLVIENLIENVLKNDGKISNRNADTSEPAVCE